MHRHVIGQVTPRLRLTHLLNTEVVLTWLQVRPLEDVGGAAPVVGGDLPVVISEVGFSV